MIAVVSPSRLVRGSSRGGRFASTFYRTTQSSANCVDDRQKAGRELVGRGDLDMPTAPSRCGDVKGTCLLDNR